MILPSFLSSKIRTHIFFKAEDMIFFIYLQEELDLQDLQEEHDQFL